MVENSSAGLSMVPGEVPVTVTREEHHQGVLARYAPAPAGERQVAVELTWCVVGSGKHRGKRAIEVRLDGCRVGELTFLMSQRYTPLVAQVTGGGGRAGCAAVITRDDRGLQLTLSLPRAGTGAPPAPGGSAAPAHRGATARIPLAAGLPRGGTAPSAAPVPSAASVTTPAVGTFTRHRTAWLVAAAVAVVLFFASLANGDDEQPSTAADLASTTTTATATTATTTVTATIPTTTPPPPPPVTTTPVAVAPPPVTAVPAPPPVVVTPEPAPQPRCDPNYGGCVPVASDVDCAGGSGNGPAYADGPVDVVGDDIYDLDSDDDRVACE